MLFQLCESVLKNTNKQTNKQTNKHPNKNNKKQEKTKKKPESFILIRIQNCVIIVFYERDSFVKHIITSFHWRHLKKKTPLKNNLFNSRNQNHCVVFVTLR